MGLVVLILFCLLNTFNFEVCVDLQKHWSVLLIVPVFGAILLFVFFMETNRPPFDLSEAESDIVAGYNVEYSGILFGLFYLGEYINLFVACLFVIITCCGGWQAQGGELMEAWELIYYLLSYRIV